MTWKEFKDMIDGLGIKSDSKLKYIDVDFSFTNIGIFEHEDGEWSIS